MKRINIYSQSLRNGFWAYTSGLILILSVAICYVFSAISFFSGIGISAYTLPVSFVVACIMSGYKKTDVNLFLGVFVALFIWVICAYICTILYDSSCDGNLYHMEIVANLYNGWNPYLYSSAIESNEFCAEHYAKAMETIGTCLMLITHRIQSSKAVTMVLAVGTLLIIPTLLRRLSPQLSRKQSLLLALLVLSNPVVICQMLRFYIDDIVYICVVLAVISSLLISINERHKQVNYTLMAVAIVLAAGTKANAMVYVAFVIICTIVGMLMFNGSPRHVLHYLLFCALTCVIAISVICFHPYLTNWITDGHPLYPLMGENAVDIMSANTPEVCLTQNRLINLLYSIFSISRPSVDQRMGGFLPPFIILFPLSIAVIGYYAWRQKKFMPVVYVFICILISCLLFEQSWWARYIPQLWLLVPLSAYCLITTTQVKAKDIVTSIIVVLGIATGMLCCITTYLGALRYTLRMDNLYEMASRRSLSILVYQPQFVRMFEENHVKYIKSDTIVLTTECPTCLSENVMVEPKIEKFLKEDEMAELDSMLRLNNFYKFGATVRRVIGKDENIPFYNTTSAVD